MEDIELGINTYLTMVPINTLPDHSTSSSHHELIIENNVKKNNSPNKDVLDERKQKRLLSNRLSAQRYRERNKKSRVDLECQAQTLQYELTEIEPVEASSQSQDQLFYIEYEAMFHENEALQQEELLVVAKDEEAKMEEEKLKELRITQQEQLLHRNIAMLEPAIVNYYSNSYPVPGNGMGTSYMAPPDPSQMWVAPVQSMQEMSLTQPNNNNMGFMDQSNLVWGGTASNPPNFYK